MAARTTSWTLLRDGQRLGAKLVAKDHPLSKDKTAHFVLYGPGGRQRRSRSRHRSWARRRTTSRFRQEYLEDCADLQRAYRCLFVHWLEEHGAGPAEDSAAHFGELIAGHAARGCDDPPDAAFDEVYGVPLSAEDGSVENLEWRFLGWLSKTR